MKYALFLLPLGFFINACGSDGQAPTTPATTEAIATPSPSPTPMPTTTPDPSILGSWRDEADHTLVFKEDATGESSEQAFHWAMKEGRLFFFTVDSTVEIDFCSYAILSSGGLQTPLVVTLSLSCEKNGAFLYTKQSAKLTPPSSSFRN